MPLRQPDSTVGPFREGNSVILRATLMDNAEPAAAIPNTALVSCTLTLYSETPVNGSYPMILDHVDIKPNISAQGALTYTIEADKMAIVSGQAQEYHRALLEWVWNVDKRGSWEIRIRVVDVNLVT